MKSPKLKSAGKAFIEDDELQQVLCEFDAVMEDFSSPFEKRHFRYDEHLQTMKRRSSASISDSGISDSENSQNILPDYPFYSCLLGRPRILPAGADSLYRHSFSFSDEKLNSPTASTPTLPSPTMTPRKAKLGDTKELEDYIADLDRTLASM